MSPVRFFKQEGEQSIKYILLPLVTPREGGHRLKRSPWSEQHRDGASE
jgi:hypothetical protein